MREAQPATAKGDMTTTSRGWNTIVAMAVDDARKEDAGDGDGFRKACSTVLHQSHLAPLPSFSHPIVWDYDQSLWMTTQPDALVLCDGSGGPEAT